MSGSRARHRHFVEMVEPAGEKGWPPLLLADFRETDGLRGQAYEACVRWSSAAIATSIRWSPPGRRGDAHPILLPVPVKTTGSVPSLRGLRQRRPFIASNIAALTIASVHARDRGDSRCSVATASALAAQSDMASADAGTTSAERASTLASNITVAVVRFACISRLSLPTAELVVHASKAARSCE